MTENMKKFLEAVSQNEELTRRMRCAGMEELMFIARELGIALTEADFKQHTNELSDDELDAVTGGSDSSCTCIIGGGGKKDSAFGASKACACVLGGGGEKIGGGARCACVACGMGTDEQYSMQ